MNFHCTLIFSVVILVGLVTFSTASGNEDEIPFRDRPSLSLNAIYNDFHPKLTKVFDPVFLNISENTIYDPYLSHMKIPMNVRPRYIHIKIVSHKFINVSSDEVSIYIEDTFLVSSRCFVLDYQ